MSALGQKQTCAPHKAMSALPPIATLSALFGMSALGPEAEVAGSFERLMRLMCEAGP
jgi:hypothetical protein